MALRETCERRESRFGMFDMLFGWCMTVLGGFLMFFFGLGMHARQRAFPEVHNTGQSAK